jgi:hypothetical protein
MKKKRATRPDRLPRLQKGVGFGMPPSLDPILVGHVQSCLDRSQTKVSAAMPCPDYIH